MSLLEAKERALYDTVWTAVDSYGDVSPGADRVGMFLDLVRPAPGASILDAGCGSGKGALALQAEGFAVSLLDLTDAGLVDEARALPFRRGCLWHDLSPASWFRQGRPDYVYCCDVLEHVPTAYAMLVVHQLLQHARLGVFLTIGTQPDAYGYFVGESLHKTAQHFAWWRDYLAGMSTIVSGRDLLNQAVFYLRPR